MLESIALEKDSNLSLYNAICSFSAFTVSYIPTLYEVILKHNSENIYIYVFKKKRKKTVLCGYEVDVTYKYALGEIHIMCAIYIYHLLCNTMFQQLFILFFLVSIDRFRLGKFRFRQFRFQLFGFQAIVKVLLLNVKLLQ